MFASSFLPHLKPHSRTADVDICDRAIPSVLRRKPDFRDTLLMPGAAVTVPRCGCAALSDGAGRSARAAMGGHGSFCPAALRDLRVKHLRGSAPRAGHD